MLLNLLVSMLGSIIAELLIYGVKKLMGKHKKA